MFQCPHACHGWSVDTECFCGICLGSISGSMSRASWVKVKRTTYLSSREILQDTYSQNSTRPGWPSCTLQDSCLVSCCFHCKCPAILSGESSVGLLSIKNHSLQNVCQKEISNSQGKRTDMVGGMVIDKVHFNAHRRSVVSGGCSKACRALQPAASPTVSSYGLRSEHLKPQQHMLPHFFQSLTRVSIPCCSHSSIHLCMHHTCCFGSGTRNTCEMDCFRCQKGRTCPLALLTAAVR